jgi:hypothetical protein
MGFVIGRLIRLARGPLGRRLAAQAQQAAKDPKNRERLEQVRSRFTKPR